MVSRVIKAHDQDSLRSVEEKMRIYGVRHMPIVDAENKVVGIMTHRDAN